MELKLPEEFVTTKIFFIRHIVAHMGRQKVILDEDLALLFQVETKRLNEQVKCNQDRFPADFAFKLISEEFEKGQLNLRFWRTEELDITRCDIWLLLETFRFYSTNYSHNLIKTKNWRCQFGTSNSTIKTTLKSIISNDPEVVAICDNL